ncbi:MAG TPA: TlpA disulfide reductase family protein [Chitinophagaceae bacterium]|jgi:thiol-disulfide isomerase/thioredoxin|nr:TlpA disulfide reductase family protein [Chitinophagaceae bacterium]
MKDLLFIVLFWLGSGQVFAQEVKVSFINDTTELQEYSNGEKLKVNYKLNNKTITLKEKDKLLNNYPGIQQEFNIRKLNNEPFGEVNFIAGNVVVGLGKETKTGEISSNKLDISENLNGRPFPAFEWKDINHNSISLHQLNGKTVVLNFWHTSCVPCIAEMPLLNKLVQKYSNEDVVFISATPNTETELKEFLKKKKFEYRQVPDVDTKTIFSPFPGWPIHIVLNRDGVIQFFALGKQNNIEEKLIESLDKCLKAAE